MITDKQLKERLNYIGGSDIASIMGVNPYDSPIDVYNAKLGIKKNIENDAIHFGNVLEESVLREFSRRYGYSLIKKQTKYHKKYRYFAANVDSCIKGTNIIVEAKTTSEYNHKYWKKSESIPIQYLYQLQWYMLVYDAPYSYICCLVGGQNFYSYKINADKKLQEKMVLQADNFWCNHVKKGIAPDVCGLDNQKLDRYHIDINKSNNTKFFQKEDEEIIENYVLLKAQEKELEKEILHVKAKIKDKLKNHSIGETLTGKYKVIWEDMKKQSFNTQKLKDTYPRIYNEFTEENIYKRFLVKGGI